MDNLYFKKLPSEVLPTVTGDDIVFVETSSGLLYRIDSGGAKQLIDMDMAFPVGIHVEQLYGEPTPAERFGGTWEIDTDYAGRTTIGSGGSYTFGEIGGEANHTLTINEMPKHHHTPLSSSLGQNLASAYGSPKNARGGIAPNTGNSDYDYSDAYVGESQSHNNMPPYKVSNRWKRIA